LNWLHVTWGPVPHCCGHNSEPQHFRMGLKRNSCSTSQLDGGCQVTDCCLPAQSWLELFDVTACSFSDSSVNHSFPVWVQRSEYRRNEKVYQKEEERERFW
jgi:hypothetical protein